MRKFISILLCFLCIFPAMAEDATSSISPIQQPESAIANNSYSAEKGAAIIKLADENTQIQGNGAVYANDAVTISQSGTYYLTGTLNGQVIIDSADEDKIELIFNGALLNAIDKSSLLILSAGKNVTINLTDDSVNLIQCTFITDVLSTDGAYDAALFSKADLKFKGNGELYITCNGGKGINCRDDVEIHSASLYITATDDGLRGKDSVTISDGNVRISSGADGIRSNNEEREDKGFITISGGRIIIDAALDAIQAYTTLTVSGGELLIESGGGAKEGTSVRNNEMSRGGFGGKGWDMDQRQSSTTSSAESTKGLKSDTNIVISGGFITADCMDDAIHANGNVSITGGQMNLASGDDGIHADDALHIQGGNILITQSYEGIEAADLQISGGETRLTSSDDGINAAGGEKETSAGSYGGWGGGRGGMGMLSTTSGNMLMTGGYVLVNSDGDGVDVNGSAEMTGGLLIVYGPSNSGNGALDYDGVFSVTGGTLLATGSSGMAQAVTASGEAQMIAFTCGIPSDTLLHIRDTAGNEILTFKSPKQYSCVVFATEILSVGTEYEVYAEGTYNTEGTDGYYTNGVYTPGTLLGTITL